MAPNRAFFARGSADARFALTNSPLGEGSRGKAALVIF